MAGGSMKDIKRRIKSIESTGQITKAMELVASSKLRRAKERAQSSEAFFETLYQTISDISSFSRGFSSAYITKREIKASLIVVIAGDRGLAGGYNSNVLKLANAAVEERRKKGIDVKVIAIGKKAVDFYEKRGGTIASFSGIAQDIDQVRVMHISSIIASMYDKKEVDEVCLYFTQFVSALSQVATELPILPLSLLQAANADKTAEESFSSCIYEPSPEGVFNAVVPVYIEGLLYCSIVESFASEQGARRTAMESASDNASDIIGSLSLSYNRARQAAITQEISEIVSGAGAL